jgi:hypothetical protein
VMNALQKQKKPVVMWNSAGKVNGEYWPDYRFSTSEKHGQASCGAPRSILSPLSTLVAQPRLASADRSARFG